jgi:O-antigen/teichoic acid export membrane protein
LPLAAAIALFSKDVVRVWLGPSAPAVTATIIVVLMVIELVDLTASPAREVLVASGRVRFLAAFALVDGTANVVLSIVLVSAHGAIGAAVATLLTSSVLAPAIVPLACRTMDCSPTTLIRQAILPAIIASLPALAIMLTVWSLLGPGIVRLTVGAISGFGAALAVASIQVGPRRGLAFIRASIGRSEESEWREVEKNALAG